MKKKRLFYIGNFQSEIYKKKISNDHFGDAATKKVINTLYQINNKNFIKICISCPYIPKTTKLKKIKKNLYIFRDKETIHLYNKPIKSVIIRKINAIFFFLKFSKLIIKDSIIIFYNSQPEYLFLVMYCYFKRIKMFLDIEDAPRNDEFTLNSKLNSLTFSIYKKFYFSKFILSTYQIQKKYNFDNYLVYHGCIQKNFKQSQYYISSTKSINIIFSGTLNNDNGFNLLLNFIKVYEKFLISNKIKFFITGNLSQNYNFFDFGYENIIQFNSYLDNYHYDKLLESCNIGLNLRNINSEINSTTFPSKILDYLKFNLIIISSANTDLLNKIPPEICFFLEDYNENSLYQTLRKIINSNTLNKNNSSFFRQCFHNFSTKKLESFLEKN